MSNTGEVLEWPEGKLGMVEAYRGGQEVIGEQSDRLLAATRLLLQLIGNDGDGELLQAAADFVVSADDSEPVQDTPILRAAEALPLITDATKPLMPKQTDPGGGVTRWTMDWAAVRAALDERIGAKPELADEINRWFMTEGSSMVATTYPSIEARRPLHFVPGGANKQGLMRSAHALASMTTAEFRAENGLNMSEDAGLNGEDESSAGWLLDENKLAEMRSHVSERIAAGEYDPRIVIGGSTDRVLKGAELNTVLEFLVDGTQLIDPQKGVTEADAMLHGALRVYGGDASTVRVNVVVNEQQQSATQVVTFDSELGEITVIAAEGQQATLGGQLTAAHETCPESFEGIDGVFGSTTAIYAWSQQATMEEAVARLPIESGIPIEMNGISAHAAGMIREQSALVGEIVTYLRALHGIAERTLAAAEQNTQIDVETLEGLGGVALNQV